MASHYQKEKNDNNNHCCIIFVCYENFSVCNVFLIADTKLTCKETVKKTLYTFVVYTSSHIITFKKIDRRKHGIHLLLAKTRCICSCITIDTLWPSFYLWLV